MTKERERDFGLGLYNSDIKDHVFKTSVSADVSLPSTALCWCNTLTPQPSGHLSVWTRRGRAAVPDPRGPPGPLRGRDQEAALPHPGRPAPPPAPHGGREVAGRPGGPVGSRREQGNQEEQRNEEEETRLHGGTA